MSHPLNVFQRLYVINLASRQDRREEMDEQLQRIGLSLRSPLVELFPAVRPADKGGFPSIGSRGCFESHLGVLKRAASEGLERILIVEDDLNFEPDFMERAGDIAARLRQPDWSMFYGGYRLDHPVTSAPVGVAVIAPDNGVQTSHFVGVQGAAITSLVAHLEAQIARQAGDPLGGPMHVDGSYTWFRRANPGLITVVGVPELGHQRASKTDVHELGLRDTLPGLRHAIAILRKLRNRR